jgi:hypothetical protein
MSVASNIKKKHRQAKQRFAFSFVADGAASAA